MWIVWLLIVLILVFIHCVVSLGLATILIKKFMKKQDLDVATVLKIAVISFIPFVNIIDLFSLFIPTFQRFNIVLIKRQGDE